MRTLGEIAHPECKISLFSWNGKFLVKFEQGPCEQIFKFEHLEISETDLRERIGGALLSGVLTRFADMHSSRIDLL